MSPYLPSPHLSVGKNKVIDCCLVESIGVEGCIPVRGVHIPFVIMRSRVKISLRCKVVRSVYRVNLRVLATNTSNENNSLIYLLREHKVRRLDRIEACGNDQPFDHRGSRRPSNGWSEDSAVCGWDPLISPRKTGGGKRETGEGAQT